jgi:16S rRNA (guanine527-N7)-methyltransferase
MTNLKPATSLIRDASEKTSFVLSEKQLEQIGAFCNLLVEYNEHMNLVSNAEFEVVVRDHVLDSFSLVPIIEKYGKQKSGRNRLIDIGSGAGFPGLILALSVAGLRVTLVEAVGKKAKFLQEVVNKLDLTEMVEIKNTRAEELAHHPQYRGQFTFATARAIGAFGIVCELTAPFLTPGGFVLVQKSVKQWTLDEPLAKDNVDIVGASIREAVILDPEILGKELAVIVLQQTKPSKAKYPRPWAQIKQSPLF